MKKLRCTSRWYDGSKWQATDIDVPFDEICTISRVDNPKSYNKDWFILTNTHRVTFYISDFEVIEEA